METGSFFQVAVPAIRCYWRDPQVVVSLLIIVAGALGYVFVDSTFTIANYFWVFVYFFAKATDMLYTKVERQPLTNSTSATRCP
jgi:hypothetical protein